VTYLYCIVRGGRKPVLRRAAGRLPGAGPVRALEAGADVWLIVADVDDAEYNEKAIAAGLQNLEWVSARAVAHEAVVEQFLAARTVLPMQLFTIFKTDARALEYVTKNRRRIERILKRIEGRVEWGVRLTWDEQAARAAVEEEHQPSRESGGASYLARKRDLHDVNRRQLADARTEATRVFKALSRHASEAVRRTSTEQAAPGSRLLLDAAYLVPVKQGSAFKTALRRHARQLEGTGVAVAVTGPWPAYNFIA
jgi:hypothetical protein